jgi:hypothetical protein
MGQSFFTPRLAVSAASSVAYEPFMIHLKAKSESDIAFLDEVKEWQAAVDDAPA